MLNDLNMDLDQGHCPAAPTDEGRRVNKPTTAKVISYPDTSSRGWILPVEE